MVVVRPIVKNENVTVLSAHVIMISFSGLVVWNVYRNTFTIANYDCEFKTFSNKDHCRLCECDVEH